MRAGVQPWHHGVVDNGMILAAGPAATLAERFSTAGYDSAAFVAAFVLHRSFGLDRGFAHYDDGPAADAALAPGWYTSWHRNLFVVGPFQRFSPPRGITKL